jgi:integrase
VPLSAAAVIVLREQIGVHAEFVSVFRGKPIRRVNTKAWRRALKWTGITNFRWRNLRHIWASWHVKARTPLHMLQELGSWESVEMVGRYVHLCTYLRI